MKHFWILLALAACGRIEDYGFKPCLDKGTAGCECLANQACASTDLVCSNGKCGTPVCLPGDPGNTGCHCNEAGPCATGLVCVNQKCEVDSGQTLAPPQNPKCHTPCRGDLVRADGTRAQCESDGLLAGCVDGGECIEGSCVVFGASVARQASGATGVTNVGAKTCAIDTDCPDFQACITGKCFSDCDSDNECRTGRKCTRHTCRVPCALGTTTCPAGNSCVTTDGLNGFCQPLAPGGGGVQATPESFTLSTTSVELTSARPASSFSITNTSTRAIALVVRKVQHNEYPDTGKITVTDNALSWLSIGGSGGVDRTVELAAGATATINVTNGNGTALHRYDGILEVRSSGSKASTVRVQYLGTAEGFWSGQMYFLSNFGEGGLDTWLADKDSTQNLNAVQNALIQRWGAFRGNRLSFRELQAVLTSTQTESWKWPSVKALCPNAAHPDKNVGCYLYDNPVGFAIFSEFLPNAPIPSGVVSIPFAMNVRAGLASPAQWNGKVLSDQALQYPGSPAVSLAFATDPSQCLTKNGNDCVTFMVGFNMTSLVGGRYAASSTDTSCAAVSNGSFSLTSTPWLVPGFAHTSAVDSTSGNRYLYECRDKKLPFGTTAIKEAPNSNFSQANPVPDGRTRRRQLTMLDGALVNQDTMIVLFKETFPSFLGADDSTGFSAYGFMVLNRLPAQLDASDYQGVTQQDARPAPAVSTVSCDAALVQKVLGPAGATALNATTASSLGVGIITGVTPTTVQPPVITPASAEKVHYYCADTGFFDGGPNDNGTAGASQVACPGGSRVVFFTVQGRTQAQIAAESCQAGGGVCRDGEPCSVSSQLGGPGCAVGSACAAKGNCEATLTAWRASNTYTFRESLVWKCTDPTQVSCSSNRLDLRAGKTFFGVMPQSPAVFRSLDDEIEEAFRYKTRFKNRTGTSVGFAPSTCVGDTDAVPYCYDPEAIEAVGKRVNCAINVYTNYYANLDDNAKATMKEFLSRAFGYGEQTVPGLGTPLIVDGYEKLNAELLIMMGDESYTSAFASRFDLAGLGLASFEGTRFEPGGINLSGGAGFEMFRLYQAAQYYQMALDRFYAQSATVWKSLKDLPAGQTFITQRTTVSYFDKLTRASSQKTRAFSEIAKRYQSFNRPDLARNVILRAYTQAYLESIIMSRLMLKIVGAVSPSDQAQIVKQVETAQMIYRSALHDMRTAYQGITDSPTLFGFTPDFVPFPALDPSDTNAFAKVLATAKDALAAAAQKEAVALQQDRTFDTDAAAFQNQLSSIRAQYEDALTAICGAIEVEVNGNSTLYPAIPKYAFLTPRTALLGDPCGQVGSGDLYQALLAIDAVRADADALKQRFANLESKAADVYGHASAQCSQIDIYKNIVLGKEDEKLKLQDFIDSVNFVIRTNDRVLGIVANAAQFGKCTVGTSTDCPGAAVAGAAFITYSSISAVVTAALDAGTVGAQARINRIEKEKLEADFKNQCDTINIDALYEVKDLMREAAEIELEFYKNEIALKQALGEIARLRNDAQSQIASEEDATQLAINVEAARNDPNVRIYKNDAIIAADRTFTAAQQAAYKATKVFEYFTSQSYGSLNDLFLVRMVSAGDFTLESYLRQLENAFLVFQEQYGNPDRRAQIISVRDDVLRIPRLDNQGIAYTEAQRTQQFRNALKNTALLDENGYLSLSFATTAQALSPLTRNHKVLYIEAEIIGENVGDQLGRVYLSQSGTGTVRPLGSRTDSFFAFPDRIAVINTYFNGDKPLDSAIYRSERLRDRPVLNSKWKLAFNQKDEAVNADIVRDSLKDIRLYVYYTDFTEVQ